MNNKYRVSISSNRLHGIVDTLSKLGEDEAAQKYIAYLREHDKDARSRCNSYYTMNTTLSRLDLKNGELVQIMSSLKEFEKFYDENTAEVLRATRALIVSLLSTNKVRNSENLELKRECEKLKKRLAE